MNRIPKYTAGMFKKKMPRFGASSIRMPRMPKPPKPRVKKFAEGGVGYEEDPQPGIQSSGSRSVKKAKAVKKDGASSRKISAMEFMRKYEDAPASERMKEEAKAAVRTSRQSLPGDRSTGFAEQRGTAKSPYVDLDEARAKEAMRKMGDAALYSNVALVGRDMAGQMARDVVKAVGKANLPLRFKQMMRRRQTAKINEMERAADKAEQSARIGMSRRGLPKYDERYRAGESAAQRRRDLEDAALSGQMYRKGGSVKSSSRGDGIAKRGKTRGKFV